MYHFITYFWLSYRSHLCSSIIDHMQTTEHMRIVKTMQSCTCRIFPKTIELWSIRWTLTIRNNVFSPTSRQTLITRREAIYSAYNVTLRRVQETVAVIKATSIPYFCECVHVDAYVCVCVRARDACSFTYPGYNAHAPYYYM